MENANTATATTTITTMTTTNLETSQQSSTALTQATIGWLKLLKTSQKMEKKYKKEMDKLRKQMTRNYRLMTAQIEKENNDRNENAEEMAKKWIRENLEEAQLFIDRTVGIKGITEDPLKVAAYLEEYGSNVIAANTEGTLQAQFLGKHDDDALTPCQPLPRVSISSSIVPSNEELYGY